MAKKKRRSRRVSVHLPRAEPSAAFLGHGPAENAIRRERIAKAGMAVALAGDWPTLKLVLEKDRRIAPATLRRNSDALDEARAKWMSEAAIALATRGEFPTLEAVRARAGAVRLKDLARVEDALTETRRRWVAEHGPVDGWTDPDNATDGVDGAEEADGSAEAPHPNQDSGGELARRDDAGDPPASGVDLRLLERQVERLLAERKKDRETIRQVTEELADAQEALRRALLPVLTANATVLNEEPATPPAGRDRRRLPTKARATRRRS